MDILPARIQPYQKKIQKRHKPQVATFERGYRQYRRCLRWEFGFTCALCLLHEGDFSDTGAEGTGQTTVEHFEPQSSDAEQSKEYENCLYVCRYCNVARSNRPQVNKQGHRLLNPTTVVWAAHFAADGDRLVPVPGDVDAQYTHKAYELDAPRKIATRELRRKNIAYCLRLLENGPTLRQKLLKEAANCEMSAEPESAERVQALRETAEYILVDIVRAWQNLKRYCAVPRDHDTACRCDPRATLQIPDALQQQVVRVTAPPEVLAYNLLNP